MFKYLQLITNRLSIHYTAILYQALATFQIVILMSLPFRTRCWLPSKFRLSRYFKQHTGCCI